MSAVGPVGDGEAPSPTGVLVATGDGDRSRLAAATGEFIAAVADWWGVELDDVEDVRVLPALDMDGGVHVLTRLDGGLVERSVWVWPPQTT
ncbi:MAG: hypothetical protein BGO37_10500 [Cellulomonas sp. 73-92]|uniref:hypothetical protein n=1 Tax=Cellulomonas sp. 73-92 TaxID=1895740 RepID=UPI00092B65F9|nr:hypothetical protein [Cellulomonas sp. 73-92]OJV76480.1 MAG: hypothetical protein BGO37_10500 [Cellulomonas sp. 73-92]